MLVVPTNKALGPAAWAERLTDIHQFRLTPALVNRLVNSAVRYRGDRDGDSWAAPLETLARGFGDCEDIAIAKAALLGDPGAILAVGHTSDGRPHAVLLVGAGGDDFDCLDNLAPEPYRLSTGRFRPSYGLGLDGRRLLFLETRPIS